MELYDKPPNLTKAIIMPNFETEKKYDSASSTAAKMFDACDSTLASMRDCDDEPPANLSGNESDDNQDTMQPSVPNVIIFLSFEDVLALF